MLMVFLPSSLPKRRQKNMDKPSIIQKNRHTALESNSLNLSFDGVLKTPSFELNQNNRKSKRIMYCVDLVFWVAVLKIWASFTYFIYLSVMGRYNPPPQSKLSWNSWKMPISSKLPLKKKINTVHNLITFSIVFKN